MRLCFNYRMIGVIYSFIIAYQTHTSLCIMGTIKKLHNFCGWHQFGIKRVHCLLLQMSLRNADTNKVRMHFCTTVLPQMGTHLFHQQLLIIAIDFSLAIISGNYKQHNRSECNLMQVHAE